MNKIKELKKEEILKIIKDKTEISIYELVKILPNEHKNSYGNIYYYVKELEKEGIIKIEKVVKNYKTMIRLV